MRIFFIILMSAVSFLVQAQPDPGCLTTDLGRGSWEFRKEGSQLWMPASVPGSVHTDLMNNFLIPDPYERVNERDVQWIDKADWIYRTNFQVESSVLAKRNIELIFEGIDTYADVFLNERLILQTDNMFRTWRVDVKNVLREGGNELLVVLKSPTMTGLEQLKEFGFQLAADNDQSEAGGMGPDRVSPYVRKAPYHFGWDWGPRLVTSGIWLPVKLLAWDGAKLENVWVKTLEINNGGAIIEVNTTLKTDQAGQKGYSIYIDNTPVASGIWDLESGIAELKTEITLRDIRLWWPNGMGEQNLFSLRVEIFNKGLHFDQKEVVFGLRTAELVREPDPAGDGESFYFRVNGVPVFAKGANYIPNDVFLDRVSPEKYEFIIRSASEANMNMLRVWGGGIYEQDIFYDLCDRYGIMVWQDFMFACAMYPGNDEFLENVRIEAEENVKRLRNHPCIVLWCGNNEIEAAWGPYDENRGWGWKQRYDAQQREIIWKAYDTLFHQILPSVVDRFDPQRPYWHSSPSAGMGKLAGYEGNSGDVHYWGVWHGQHPFSDFRKYRARFMSEYGFQSFPEYSTVKKYAPLTEDQNIESEVMMAHQRSGIGNLRIRQYMESDYQVPEDFEQLLYVGQLLQADAIRTAIESHRGDMPFCMGSLYWQLNDVWPVASWSSIDYFGRWKALHYAVREAFKPAALLVTHNDSTVNINIVSDLSWNRLVTLEVKIRDFSGNSLWTGSYDHEMTSRCITHSLSIPISDVISKWDRTSIVLETRLIDEGSVIDMDYHYLVLPKDLKLMEPGIGLEYYEEADKYVVLLRSSFLAKNIFLSAEGFQGQFSDNFFDLMPGAERAVTFPKESTLENFKESFRIMHLQMTMK